MKEMPVKILPPEFKMPAGLVDDIHHIVCSYLEVDPQVVCSNIRRPHISRAREFSIHFARQYTKATLKVLSEYYRCVIPTVAGADKRITLMVEAKRREYFSLYISMVLRINALVKSLYPVSPELYTLHVRGVNYTNLYV